MNGRTVQITSPRNPRVRGVLKLRKRAHRDETGQFIVEGYRELHRALDNDWKPAALFFSRAHFLGYNEEALVERCAAAGAALYDCSSEVFAKMAYRDRPEGLLAVGPQRRCVLEDIPLGEPALVVVAEAIEKPGNLGTILRSADAAGAHGVLLCDRCTDLNNPNVVRASIGTLFALPVVEVSSSDAAQWLKRNAIQIVAATPRARRDYTQADFRRPSAVAVGTEQYGLSDRWLEQAECEVRIPMFGQVDSLNVASATTILLFEAVRQRRLAPQAAATHQV